MVHEVNLLEGEGQMLLPFIGNGRCFIGQELG